MSVGGPRRVMDRRGHLVLLAEVVPIAPEEADVPAVLEPSNRPDGVAVDEWARRQDAVREAAREFETLSPQDIKERLRGLTSRELDEDDVKQFEVDVRAQQLDDLCDALDQMQRGVKRGRRTVRIQMPRGYLRFALHRLTQDEVDELGARLTARGWSADDLRERLTSKLSKKQLDVTTSPE